MNISELLEAQDKLERQLQDAVHGAIRQVISTTDITEDGRGPLRRYTEDMVCGLAHVAATEAVKYGAVTHDLVKCEGCRGTGRKEGEPCDECVGVGIAGAWKVEMPF